MRGWIPDQNVHSACISLKITWALSKNDWVYLGQIVMSLHPGRNISRLGDRDRECQVSNVFDGVHTTLRRNHQGGRGHLEIALSNKPLGVSPLFTVIWLMVQPDRHPQTVNIHSLTTNKSSLSYLVGHGFKVLRFLPTRGHSRSSWICSKGYFLHDCDSSAREHRQFIYHHPYPTDLHCHAATSVKQHAKKSQRTIMCHICSVYNNCSSAIWRSVYETHVCHLTLRNEESYNLLPRTWD